MPLPYWIAWFALAPIAIANGLIRELTYGKLVSELAAHQISTVTAAILVLIFVWLMHRKWPIRSATQAWAIGAAWLTLTILFEFGFGHLVVGHPWERLLADYNVLEGRVWALFLLWILVSPIMVLKYSNRAQSPIA